MRPRELIGSTVFDDVTAVSFSLVIGPSSKDFNVAQGTASGCLVLGPHCNNGRYNLAPAIYRMFPGFIGKHILPGRNLSTLTDIDTPYAGAISIISLASGPISAQAVMLFCSNNKIPGPSVL